MDSSERGKEGEETGLLFSFKGRGSTRTIAVEVTREESGSDRVTDVWSTRRRKNHHHVANPEALLGRSGSLRPIGETLALLMEGPDPDPDGAEVGDTVFSYVPELIGNMQEDMREYDMKCVALRKKWSEFLALEVPGLAERRPSLVYRDFNFAKISSEDGNDSTHPYQVVRLCREHRLYW